MSSHEEITLPATRAKSRKSLAHVPSSTMDQENMTADIGAVAGGKRAALVAKASKKLRSKSIGPGGLDALRDAAGNRRKSLATVPHPPPRSILKPTMPPLRDIPAHISARKGSPKKPTPQSPHPQLLDFNVGSPIVSGTEKLANPFHGENNAAINETRIALRTEEEQQAAARDREEQERKEMETEANSRREARRKSLANRRVSFAPEATLHTWDVVVEYQDTTTSSNSTNSTRRALSMSGTAAPSPESKSHGPHSSDPSEPPSTPPEQTEEDIITASPAHQRDLHQKKRRRSSAIPPMNFNNPDEEGFSSSPFGGSSVGDADETTEVNGDDESNSNSGSEDDDGTMMSIDGGETTDMSIASVKSTASDSSGRLEEALRMAARQAGTQGIEFDEYGENELAEDEEVLANFAPFTKKASIQNLESQQDQENVNPFSPAFRSAAPERGERQLEEDEMTMEMTRAVGGILPTQQEVEEEMSMDVTRAFGGIIFNELPKTSDSRRKSMASGRRQSTRRRSSGGASSREDETMDFTMAVGGIQSTDDDTVLKDDEEMTMEFTSAVGGVLPAGNPVTRSGRGSTINTGQNQSRRNLESPDSAAEDDTMDMTTAIGGIMPSTSESMTGEIDVTVGMEMTTAIGGILPQQVAADHTRTKQVMELEADVGSSPFRLEVVANSPNKPPLSVHTVASETGSPSLLAFRGKSLRRSTEAQHSTTPISKLSSGTPIKKPVTPSKQLTPQPARPITPGKTPPSKNVVMRTASPKRLFKNEIKAASSNPQSSATKKGTTPNRLFQNDKGTGMPAPSFVLTPQRRVSSGLGIDRVGLGSPRVAALLDRRGSIGEQARSFVPGQLGNAARGVRFDPREFENEVNNERETVQGEEEKDATINLKELIQSMTPKKKPLKGRKSLHVGAAKGILGKRPVELDEDDEDEENDGMKRLKGHQGSPVKNVKLQAPPSKADTTGRLTRTTRKSFELSSTTPATLTSPMKGKIITPPHAHDRFGDNTTLTDVVPFAPPEGPVNEDSFGDDRIQLQDFLNMTSIRFMELTTTKRRHTIAPKEPSLRDSVQDESEPSLEDCVAAGAATVPMLELFQHACHELKNYISEGRKTVREIETETFEENPPLFREYISASADVKIVMDNQLKNVKTHARLLSKGMWYEWRMTLLATLKDGLFKTVDGMTQDGKILDKQLALLNTALPSLIRQAKQLEQEEADLQSAADDLANCDQGELGEARQQLITVDADIEAKKQLIAELQKQLQGKEAEILLGTERKQVCLDEIREAEKVREECRGWSSSEISQLKEKVDQIERTHGWTITGVSGTTTSMTYRKEIELVFDASSFSDGPRTKRFENSRIDIWYIAANRELSPAPLTPELDFFLKNIRDHVRGLPQAQTPIKTLLREVSTGWNKASAVANSIRISRVSCPTEIRTTSDNSILVKQMLLIAPLTTKVEITFQLTCRSGGDGINITVSPSAAVIYGERFNEPKMGEFLLSRCGNCIEDKGQATKASWGAAVAELGEKLLARGRK